VAQLAEAGLVDEFQVVINPVVIGAGRTMFEGVSRRLMLQRTSERAFGNGNVVVCYQPA
jgi:riboflavin biosynthesis pyrimidine reductase